MPKITIEYDDGRPAVATYVSDDFDNMAILAKLPPNEPFWILRGQDKLAPATVRFWANAAESADVPAPKVANARRCAEAMLQHRPRKVPD